MANKTVDVLVKAKADVSDAQRQLRSLEKQKITLEANVKNLDKVNRQLKNQKLRLEVDEQKLEQTKNKIREINKEINAKKKKLSVETDPGKIEKLKKDIEKLRDKKINLSISKSKILNDIDNVKARIKELEAKKIELEANTKNATSQIDKLDNKIDDLKSELAQRMQVLMDTQDAVDALNRLEKKVESIRDLGQSLQDFGTNMLSGFGLFDNTLLGKAVREIGTGIWRETGQQLFRLGRTAITDAFSSGLSRYDTLKQSEIILSSLGLDDKQVQHTRDSLVDAVTGLPTSLDSAFGITTDFISGTNLGVQKSIDLFKALDDGILGFGGDAEEVEGISQALLKTMAYDYVNGTFWRSITSNHAMAMMQSVAKRLGFSDVNELRKASGKGGTVTPQDVIDALIEADVQGIENIPAFADVVEEANNTISKSYTIMKQRISQGIADLITDVNDLSLELTGKPIFEHIRDMGQGVGDVFREIGNWLKEHKGEVGNAIDWISEKMERLKEALSFENIENFAKGFFDTIPLESMGKFAEGVVGVFDFLGKTFGGGDTATGLGKLLAGYITFAKGLQIAGGVIKTLALPIGILATLMGKAKKLKLGGLLSGAEESGGLFGSIRTLLFGKGGSALTAKDIGLSGLNSLKNIGTMLGYAVTLRAFAWALKGVDEAMPDDMGNFLGKLGTLFSAMALMNLEGLATGAMAKFVGYENQLAGVATMVGEGGALWLFAKGLGELNNAIPDNVENFGEKVKLFGNTLTQMTVLTEAIAGINMLANQNPVTGIAWGVSQVEAFASMFAQGGVLYTLADAMGHLDKMVPDDVSSFKPKLTALKETLDWVQSNLDLSFFGAIGQSYKADNAKQVQDTVDSLVGMATSLGKLKDVKLKGVNAKIDALNTFLGKMVRGEGLTNAVATLSDELKDISFDKVGDFFTFLGDVPAKVKSFRDEMDKTGGLNLGDFKAKAQPLSDILDYLFTDFAKGMPKLDEESLTQVTNAEKGIAEMEKVFVNLRNFSKTYSGKGISKNEVQGAINNLTSSLEPLVNATVFKKGGGTKTNLGNLILGPLGPLFGGAFQAEDADVSLNEALKSLPDATTVTNAQTALTNLKSLATALSAIGGMELPNVNPISISGSINKITSSIDVIINSGLKEKIDSLKEVELGEMKTQINSLKKTLTSLAEIGGTNFQVGSVGSAGTVANVVNEIKKSITEIASLKGYEDMANAEGGIAGVQSIVDSMKTAIEGLSSLAEPAETSGSSIADSLISGFEKVETEIPAKVESGAKAIDTKVFTAKGKVAGVNFSNAFKDSLDLVVSADKVSLPDVTGLASGLAQQFNQAFNSSINLDIGGKVSSVISGSPLQKVGASRRNSTSKQNGGPITQYLSGGSFVRFVPKGTDKVPAMLTPGEFVVRKKAVDKFGTSMLTKLNNMDVKGLYNEFANGFGSSQMELNRNNTVINNYNTTNNDHRTVNINGGKNERQDRIKAGRFMRSIA